MPELQPGKKGKRKRSFAKGPKAIGRQSCVLCIVRTEGELLDVLKVPSDVKSQLKYLMAHGARHSFTEAQKTDTKGVVRVWYDYWRIPMNGRHSLRSIRQQFLRGAKLPEQTDIVIGPTWGKGECRGIAVGSGTMPLHARPSALRRRRYRELVAAGKVTQLTFLSFLFGEKNPEREIWRLPESTLVESLNRMSLETIGEPLPATWKNNAAEWLADLAKWNGLALAFERYVNDNLDRLALAFLKGTANTDNPLFAPYHYREQDAFVELSRRIEVWKRIELWKELARKSFQKDSSTLGTSSLSRHPLADFEGKSYKDGHRELEYRMSIEIGQAYHSKRSAKLHDNLRKITDAENARAIMERNILALKNMGK